MHACTRARNCMFVHATVVTDHDRPRCAIFAVITNEEKKKRSLGYKAKGINDLYFMEASGDQVIDAYTKGECHSYYDSFSNT